MDEFRFTLTDEEKSFLKDLVRLSIARRLNREKDDTPPEPPTDLLKQDLGAFVTLKLGRNLRGCIGNITGTRPLYLTVYDMARASAFEDPRFPPLSPHEFENLSIEISILSEVKPCPDPERVEIGRHGLVVRQGGNSGLLLPQVPLEWGWDREAFLAHTCRKAGLPPDAWKQKNTSLFWFEAVVF